MKLVDEYTYLGLLIIPSGSLNAALLELCKKANRAYFSIQNILFTHKKMPVLQALKLVDSLVFPVCNYASDFITPLIMTNKSYTSTENLLQFWEQYEPEKINQRICRLLLSVHKKSSRLAVLGELGRYPVFLTSLKNTLKYCQVLLQKPQSTLVYNVMRDMEQMCNIGQDCWLSKVKMISQLLDLPTFDSYISPNIVGHKSKFQLENKFQTFFLSAINQLKLSSDGQNHNKLRFYSSIKGCFKPEWYVTNIHNRNNRSEITRIRISASNLRVEQDRYTTPPTPLNDRICKYCPNNTVFLLPTSKGVYMVKLIQL